MRVLCASACVYICGHAPLGISYTPTVVGLLEESCFLSNSSIVPKCLVLPLGAVQSAHAMPTDLSRVKPACLFVEDRGLSLSPL
jgi:hypothetical protein